MIRELTIEQAKQHPNSFLYVFASEKYLSYISAKYRDIIRTKKLNEIYLLKLSAEKYLKNIDKWTEYKSAISSAFEEAYGITPEEALVKLALGQEVAGKNWEKGVFGVGAVKSQVFKNVEVNGQEVSVNAENGHILCGTQDLTKEKDTVFANVNGQTVPYQLFGYTQNETMVFMSQLNKTTGKYYAATYSSDGVTYDAATNKEKTTSDSASIWETITLSIKDFIEWILSFFGITTTTATSPLTEENTLPNQKADGYVQEAGMGEAGVILIALAAGGLLLAKSGKKKIK